MEKIESYKVIADNVEVEVIIAKDSEKGIVYSLILPKWEPATVALIKEIRHELITEVQVSTQEILDPTVIETLKHRFIARAEEHINSKLPNLNKSLQNKLIGSLIHDMLGLGEGKFLLNH